MAASSFAVIRCRPPPLPTIAPAVPLSHGWLAFTTGTGGASARCRLGHALGHSIVMSDERSAVLEFVATAAHLRAAHYREQAAQLREMAAAEPIGRLRDRLTDLA